MKILLADDHRMMRDGLRALLEREGLEVVAEAADGREAVSLVLRLHPDIVIMDVSMPELNGIDATRKLRAEAPKTKVIGLSMNADRRYVLAMFAAGAVGYLLKSSASEELIQALRAVSAGQKYVSPAIANIVLEHLTEGPAAGGSRLAAVPQTHQIVKALTTREREVLQLLAEGKASKEIAAQLGISLATVETHRRQIMDKLGLRTVAELTKYAIREGLTSIE